MAQLLRSFNRSILISWRSAARSFSTPVNQPPPTPTPESKATSDILSNKVHKVDDFERKLLVMSGKYKTKEEVPDYVHPDAMEKARNKFRIKMANIMMLLTVIGCILMVMSGKKAVEKGESVQKMNQDWHAEYQQQAKEDAMAKMQKK